MDQRNQDYQSNDRNEIALKKRETPVLAGDSPAAHLLRVRDGEQRALHELLAKHEAKQKVNDNDDDLDDNQRPDLARGARGGEAGVAMVV